MVADGARCGVRTPFGCSWNIRGHRDRAEHRLAFHFADRSSRARDLRPRRSLGAQPRARDGRGQRSVVSESGLARGRQRSRSHRPLLRDGRRIRGPHPRERRARLRHPRPGVLDLDGPAPSRIGPFERAVLALPLVGSLALGLPLYVFPRPFARFGGLAGDDTFIYELGGAEMIGYGVALALGVRNGLWSPIRFVILATYAFVALAFLAGFVSFASNQINGLVVIVSLWAVVVAWALAQILVAHRGAVAGPRDVAPW